MKSEGVTILEVGAEGGSLTLLGRKQDSASWIFWLQRDETAAYEALSEDDRSGVNRSGVEPVSRSPEITTLPEAIKMLDRYPWHRLYPMELHHEFIDDILLEVRKRGTAEEIQEWETRSKEIIGGRP